MSAGDRSASNLEAGITSDATGGHGGAYRWYVLVLLMLVYTVHGMDRTIINVLLEPIREEFGLSDSALGLLTGLGYALPFALTGIPLGILVDRINRKRLLAALITIWSGFTALCGLAPSYGYLLASRMAVGATESGSPPSALALISDYFPAQIRSSAVSVFYIGAPTGAMLGAYFGGLLTASYGWRTALYVAAVPGFVLAALLLLTVREPKRGQSDETVTRENATFMDALRMARMPSHACLFAALIFGSLSSVGISSWIPALLMRAYQMPVGDAGSLTALAGLIGMAGTALGGILSDYYAKGRTEKLLFLAGFSHLICIPPFLYGLLFVDDIAAFAPLLFLWSFLHVIYFGPGFSLALGLTPASLRGRMMALIFVLMNMLGAGMGPQIVGWVSDALTLAGDSASLRHAVAALTVATFITGMLFLLARRWIKPGITEPVAC
ncbi:MAG: MFS transporter [Novosphingobium sp.]|nr:MFS transporter [Novosphingobium sp.]